MTSVQRGGKLKRRPAAMFFLTFCALWVVDIKGCKCKLHGWFLKKMTQQNYFLKQPNTKKATTQSNFSKSVHTNYSNYAKLS